MSYLNQIVNASGGLGYHFRARRYAALWTDHKLKVADWLKAWPLTSRHLLLVGVSAGYSLPDDFLHRFKTVSAIDLDPLAPWLFAKHHRTSELHWSRRDYWLNDNQRLNPQGFESLRHDYPDAAILFCNVIGQFPLKYRMSEHDWLSFKSSFNRFAAAGEWASYHDIWSKTKNNQQYLQVDHLTEDLAADSGRPLERERWLWQITPLQAHCIEGVRPSKHDSGANT